MSESSPNSLCQIAANSPGNSPQKKLQKISPFRVSVLSVTKLGDGRIKRRRQKEKYIEILEERRSFNLQRSYESYSLGQVGSFGGSNFGNGETPDRKRNKRSVKTSTDFPNLNRTAQFFPQLYLLLLFFLLISFLISYNIV